MTREAHNIEHAIGVHHQSDGYRSHYRRWGQPEGHDAVVYLHGGVSHAGWQAPLAAAIVSTSEISFIAPDRRGSGLNDEARGHLVSEAREIEDISSLLRSLAGSFTRIHVAGWCFGGQVASIVAARMAGQAVLSSLILVAPGFYYNERYGDVLRLSMQAVSEVVKELDLKPDPMRAFVPVPLQPTDFTDRQDWLQFITDDKLRLTRVTQSTVAVWAELAERSVQAVSGLGGLPVLAVFGNRDRLVDVDRSKALLVEQVRPAPTIELLDTHHAIHFEDSRALAAAITGFISRLPQRHAVAAASGPGVATAARITTEP